MLFLHRRFRQAVKEFQPDLMLKSSSVSAYSTGAGDMLSGTVRYMVSVIIQISDRLQKNVLKQEYIKAQIAKLNRIFALHEEQKTQICQMFHVTARTGGSIWNGL